MSLKSRVMGIVIGSVFVIAVTVTSARADSVHSLWFLQDVEKDRLSFRTQLDSGELGQIGNLRSDPLANGGHQGSLKSGSVSSASTFSFSDGNQSREYQGGATFEKPSQLAFASFSRQSSVTPNPEPTTMLLLGSGLVALGAYARRKFHP